MALLDEDNRSKDEVTETLEVASLHDGNIFKRLLMVTVTFSFLTLSAVLGLSYVLLAERNTLQSIVVLPHTLESTGTMVDKILKLSNQGSHCLVESSVEAIQLRIRNGDSVALQLKGYSDHFVAIAMDQNNDQCFFNAQGRRVCVSSSTNCEEFPVEPHNRNLLSPDEEYDARCKAYVASVEKSDPEQWAYTVTFVAECVASCQSLGCPCICFNDDIIPPDFVVPGNSTGAETPEGSTSDAPSSVPSSAPSSVPSPAPSIAPSSAPTHNRTRRQRPCRKRMGAVLCSHPEP